MVQHLSPPLSCQHTRQEPIQSEALRQLLSSKSEPAAPTSVKKVLTVLGARPAAPWLPVGLFDSRTRQKSGERVISQAK